VTKGAATCFAMKRTDVIEPKGLASKKAPAQSLDTVPEGYGPSDIQAAYKLPEASGAPTVAIVDAYDNPNVEEDLAVYREQYGLPPCTTANGCFQKLNQDGKPSPLPPSNTTWAGEIALDVDAVSAACPACHIMLIEASSAYDDLYTAVDTARVVGAKFISMSWGGYENGTENSLDEQYFKHPGVVYTVSTGDDGYSYGAIYPATSQYTIAVGGTSLTQAEGTPRGWSERAWDDTGSGCSYAVTKPSWQGDIADCATRADSDVSAVADPGTGLAVYNTFSDAGWAVYGGTSLSAPLIASMYAIAGTPVPDTYPSSYLYADAHKDTDLNDVTEGSNGNCSSVLCNAGKGWDGPTGVGTPNGVNALSAGPRGDIKGQVTDAETHQPIANAAVTTQDNYTATTDANGAYDLRVPVGTYDVTAKPFGYTSQTTSGISVADGKTASVDFSLKKMETHLLSGTVTDGSGHGWPMYSKITIDGYPDMVHTDPFTGKYSVALPKGSYKVHVEPADAAGYQVAGFDVDVDATDAQHDVGLKVTEAPCVAPGYAYTYVGGHEEFTDWDAADPKDGWSNVDNLGDGRVWRFDNPGNRPAPPGGDGHFAVMDSDHYGFTDEDTSLVSPVTDLSNATNPEISFDTQLEAGTYTRGYVDLSLDGGQTWSNVWQDVDSRSVHAHITIPVPQAAGKSSVRVRFHDTDHYAWWWSVDNVLIGNRLCSPVEGGLLTGVATDGNTQAGLAGVKVTDGSESGGSAVSVATPDDPNVPDGFYQLFSPGSGSHSFTASLGAYTPATTTANISADAATRKDWPMAAGLPQVGPASISMTETVGEKKSAQITLANNGTKPLQFTLAGRNGPFAPMAGQTSATGGARLQKLAGVATPHPGITGARPKADAKLPAAAASGPWQSVADLPQTIQDNLVAYDRGKVYSIGGFGLTDTDYVTKGFVYDPTTHEWSSIADAPAALGLSSGAFVDGKLYMVGGADSTGNPSRMVYVYDPTTNRWSKAASLPRAESAAATAVLDGQLYIIGGCSGACDPTSSTVYRYDPATDSWTRLADYPVSVAYAGCAGVKGEVVCAGGLEYSTADVDVKSTYIYDPKTDMWSKGADMPYTNWGMAYSGAGDKLQMVAGASSGLVTNQSSEYDPATDTWSALPYPNTPTYRGGSACGMYKVGGSTGGYNEVGTVELLPGYDQCDGAGPPWMTESQTKLTVAPGAQTAVTVTLDSSRISQPGTYSADIVVRTDSPYPVQKVHVTLQVNPPSSWGKVTGTVTDAGTGTPLPAATVRICTYVAKPGTCGQVSYTLKTDKSGHYQLWLDKSYNPLQVLVADDGYQPETQVVKISKEGTTTADFSLDKT
jgi:N-acetylneuraminic acid mutarotase